MPSLTFLPAEDETGTSQGEQMDAGLVDTPVHCIRHFPGGRPAVM